MAAKQSKKSKFDRNRAKCLRYKSENRRDKNKMRRIERDHNLRDRADAVVSVNCLKKRRERGRNSTPVARREANYQGSIQFGESAKGWHIHQRENGLPTALTPKEFQKEEERRRLITHNPAVASLTE